jgi:hypothetical protein
LIGTARGDQPHRRGCLRPVQARTLGLTQPLGLEGPDTIAPVRLPSGTRRARDAKPRYRLDLRHAVINPRMRGSQPQRFFGFGRKPARIVSVVAHL